MRNDLAELDVFYGDLTAARARIYARLPWFGGAEGLTLAGEVKGPFCRQAATLPSRASLADCGPGATLLGMAELPDPCFWSPDLPAIYEVTVHLQRGPERLATATRQIGLRSLGCRQNYFLMEGKRWVLRGVLGSSAQATNPAEWREASACFLQAAPSEEVLGEASREGALTVVAVNVDQAQVAEELRRIARFPGVAMAVLDSRVSGDTKLRSAAPNLILAQSISANKEAAIQPWAQVLWAIAEEPEQLRRLAESVELPVIAVRALTRAMPIEEARAACDVLQRDLAAVGQFAGYVV